MNIHLIPGYPATSESLRSRIAFIARIFGNIYPGISPDTIHQPGQWYASGTLNQIIATLMVR
jgi:hypothetical protein